MSNLGWIPIAGAAIFTAVAGLGFRRAGTTVMPYREASALVTDGIYGYSRNPMYVCFVGGLIGIAIVLGSLSPLIVLPPFIWFINCHVIAGEEAMMRQKFGDRYRAYEARVRRWI